MPERGLTCWGNLLDEGGFIWKVSVAYRQADIVDKITIEDRRPLTKSVTSGDMPFVFSSSERFLVYFHPVG